ncbi:CBP80/20-dependent translation initiation factor isoform X2 [Neoarius graeffei]|uniref:CBP80/20-dependent translation initiation factor isoform X2 n=1 Tax=Neoarius graeffei TaxID=443677 RepID=UPI00298D51D2|nr:CBP80/20-dependent translation initiation factor isoform X2 [Neoarius graeffei]
MESSSVASASSEAGSTRSQEIEELERFIDSYVLEYQVQGLLNDKNENENADKTQSNISQWTEDCSDKIDGSWSSSRGRDSSKPDEWEHSSNGSTGSRLSSGSRPGSGSRSGSQGRNKQFCPLSKNGNRDGSFDILGTDIWAANTMDSHGGATWDLQPEKLDFSQFHRKQHRGTPKPLPHIDREGMMKSRFNDDDDGIDLNDIEKFLPGLPVFPPLPNEAEIAHTKKLFRRRRNDRRRQQRPPGGGGGGGGPKSHNPQQQHQQVPPHSQQQHQQVPPHSQQQHQQMPPHSQQQHQMTNQTQQLVADPQSEAFNAKYGHGGRGYQSGHQGRGHHHGYSQNRRWHQQHRQPGQRNTKDTDSMKEEENIHKSAGGDDNKKDGRHEKPEGGKVSLLQSSKERLSRRLKEKDEVPVATPGPQRNRMDKLLEILNSMRSNSSGVEAQLTSFMEEAQSSAQSEETLSEIVHTIYSKAVRDRGFAATAAKLCYKMALFMVEGTKFRSLLLNMLQKDFTRREELQQTDVESWLGFITFLCEVFSTMRSSTGEPFRVLVCPIYTCLRELLESAEVKEDAVLCCSMELQSAGRLLEEQLPEMMMELLAAVRDKMLSPSESPLTRSLLMEVIELHAHQWRPLEALTTQYYNRTIQKLTA